MVSSFIAMKPPYIYIYPNYLKNSLSHKEISSPTILTQASFAWTPLKQPTLGTHLSNNLFFLKILPSQKTLFALVTFSNFNDMRDHPSNAKWRLPCRQVKPKPHAFSEGKNGVWFEKSPLPYGKTREDLFAFIEYTTK